MSRDPLELPPPVAGDPVAPMPGTWANLEGAWIGVTRPYLKPWDIAPHRAANEPAKPPRAPGDDEEEEDDGPLLRRALPPREANDYFPDEQVRELCANSED